MSEVAELIGGTSRRSVRIEAFDAEKEWRVERGVPWQCFYRLQSASAKEL